MKFHTYWRRTWMGLATVTGLGRQGFFIPYRYADRVPEPETIKYGQLEKLFSETDAAQIEFIKYLNIFKEVFVKIDELSPPEPRWLQDWFPRLDAAAAYGMVARERPKIIVEVGSGHSTRFMAKAVRDNDLDCQITAIDPSPRADISSLGPVSLQRCQLSEADTSVFQTLAAGDILFIDSSHILMPGTDVDSLLNEVLPTLPAGVLVHIHDVFLPDGYPASWSWRGYNEQQGIAALLQGGAYEIIFSSHYAQTRLADTVKNSVIAQLPIPANALESSLWIRKVS